MSGIDDRESGFENKYAHDQELDFKANARRNKLLGLWAAELMGLDGEAATAYAKTASVWMNYWPKPVTRSRPKARLPS